MNTWEVDEHANMHPASSIIGRAARFLQQFRDVINENSDGWSYWHHGTKCSKKLQELILRHDPRIKKHDTPEATERELKAALTPIKTACTRLKLPCPNFPS